MMTDVETGLAGSGQEGSFQVKKNGHDNEMKNYNKWNKLSVAVTFIIYSTSKPQYTYEWSKFNNVDIQKKKQ